MKPLCDACFFQHRHRAAFEHAGADAGLDVSAVPGLEDDAVDAAARENTGEEKSRGARADDPDLRAHLNLPAGDVLAQSCRFLCGGLRAWRAAHCAA